MVLLVLAGASLSLGATSGELGESVGESAEDGAGGSLADDPSPSQCPEGTVIKCGCAPGGECEPDTGTHCVCQGTASKACSIASPGL